ncbi:LOW QUALITY PROTEIN: protein associated with UVRAG as autophagy enhancer [Plectropomus leopardus]|uniref:LOW QUALITY PROTEIN: protein associated with UVRAG as autophagy enhancer n=1 Tax=Plectropomus leopardus TaxID=160734 RepID=UPI001C4B00B9|nr:LOW QUALITY PROTEIN: protein associated with UVRAG as autophagy enhancer [Plectropomus leopardus]
MMGSCGGVSSSVHRRRYVSWCVDSAESPTPGASAPTATASSNAYSHQNHQPAGPGSVPLLLLTPPETSEGETNSAFHQQPKHSQPTFTKRTHHEAFTHSRHSSAALRDSHKDPDHRPDEDDDGDEGGKVNKDDSSLSRAEDKILLLPRSSPVITGHHRPVSWHGGVTDTPASPSSDSRCPAPGSLSLDQRGRLTVSSLQDMSFKPSSCPDPCPLQEDKKLCHVSASSHLSCNASAKLHPPCRGQQGLAGEHRGWGLSSCDAPHSSGLTSSTATSKNRRCSGIPEFPADIFKTSCELEKENAHFIVVDMVLEVLEGVKWTLSSTTDTHGHTHCDMCTHGHTHCDMCTQGHTQSCAEDAATHEQRCEACRHTHTCSTHRDTHPSYEHEHTHPHTRDEEEEAQTDEAEHLPKTFSVISTDSGFEDCGVEAALAPRDSLRDAERLAQQLVLEFRRSWLPSRGPRRGRQSLRSSLQELPGTGGVAVSSGSLAEEIRLRTRMRGSLSWAPPRFQIIFTVQPTHRRGDVVALQHFLCAGCGTEVEPRYIKKLRYCEYLGRYFCDCCHSGAEAVIPGRLLSCWDFSKYPVSDFSKNLLNSVWHQPLFDLTCVGKTLYSRVKELDKFRELQEQLMDVKKLLTACRFSGRVTAELEQLPAHLLEQLHLFSMDDLLRVKKGQLVTQARALLHSAVQHVENCELCLARGFICEFCRERDIIFPFQRGICRRCPVCRACFHKHCFVEKKCPKCARIQSRKKRPDGSRK